MKRIAVVILNYNGLDMLKSYLPSVIKYSENLADIYIADNASEDGSIKWVKENHKEVKLIELSNNYGFTGGYNKALKGIKNEYYLLLNSDVEVVDDYLSPLLHFMDQNPDVAAVQPKILSLREKGKFEYAGACGGFIDKYGYPYCRGRIFNHIENDCGQYDIPIETDWASGAALFIRSEDYNSVCGFDESFFAHQEEIDLCWRLRIRGRKIYCIPISRVYHLGGGTLAQGNPRKTYLNFRNNLTMLYKNLGNKEIESVMRVRFILDWITIITSIISNKNIKEAAAIYRARKDFKKRRINIVKTEQTTNIKKSTLKPISIIIENKIRGKKCFSEIHKHLCYYKHRISK